MGLHDLVAFRHHRERCMGIGTEEDLVVGMGLDVQATVSRDIEEDRGFVDLPVHAGLLLPDFEGLIGLQAIAEAVPGFGIGVGHGLDEVGHEEFPFGNVGVRRPPARSGSVRAHELN